MREHVKSAKNYLSNHMGFSRAFRYVNRKHIPILTYHLVCDKGNQRPTRAICSISRMEFEGHIEFLTRHYRIIPLSVIVECVRNERSFPQRGVVITFDDGFRNFANVAYPVLRAKSLPVTVFLSSGLIGSSELFWFDRVERVLLENKLQEISLRVGHRRLQIGLREKDKAIKQLVEEMKTLSYSERERVLAELVRMSGDSNMESLGDEYLPMSWDEVRELAKDKNVTFGSHTVSHSIVRWLGEEDLHREIVQSKKTLEDNLQGSIEHFSYPNGQPHDFDYRAKKQLALAGYRSASTTIEDLNHRDTDCFELRRIGASLSLGELIPKISGLDGFLLRSFGNLPGVRECSVPNTKDLRLG